MSKLKSIGIDIGGGTAKGGLVDLEGNIIGDKIVITTKGVSEESIGQGLVGMVKGLEGRVGGDDKILGVGLCAPGKVNNETGVIEYGGPNLPFNNFNVRKLITGQTGYKVEIVNDGYATARGELKYGAAKEFKKSVVIAPGTGTAVTEIDNGVIKGTEFGHMTLVMDGEPCNCTNNKDAPNRGCAEQYTSTSALKRITREAMQQNPNSLMWMHCEGDLEKVSGRTSFDCAAQGDKVAQQVIDTWTKYLGHLANSAANAYKAEGIVLAGAVLKERERISVPVQNVVNKIAYGGIPPKVKHAKFPGDSALIGAAAADFERE